MWLDDVVSHTTIRSVWGNSVRDRIVQTFDTVAERDTHTAALPNGSLCYTADTASVWYKRAGSWYPLTPAVVNGTCLEATTFVTGTQYQLASVNVPAGFRSATLVYSGRSITNTFSAAAWPMLDFIWLAPGSSQIFRTQESYPGNLTDYRQHHHISVTHTAVNPAAVNYYQLNVATSEGQSSRRFVNDGSQQCYAIAFP